MIISSRTPEGDPHRCPVCGNVAALEPSYPGGDSICPSCGHLLWWFRDRLGEDIGLRTSFQDIRADSLDIVELIMELEEEYSFNMPDRATEQFKTVEDLIRFLREHGKP